jgi:TPR repeat protein
MKRIILGLSLVLMLIQNGFAKSDAEYDKEIRKATLEVNKQIDRCNKIAGNHLSDGNPEVCEKALKMIQKDYPNEKEFTSNMYVNAGLLYATSKKNYIKAYEYFMKSAKLGNIHAQKGLDILCREHSWACK